MCFQLLSLELENTHLAAHLRIFLPAFQVKSCNTDLRQSQQAQVLPHFGAHWRL